MHGAPHPTPSTPLITISPFLTPTPPPAHVDQMGVSVGPLLPVRHLVLELDVDRAADDVFPDNAIVGACLIPKSAMPASLGTSLRRLLGQQLLGPEPKGTLFRYGSRAIYPSASTPPAQPGV